MKEINSEQRLLWAFVLSAVVMGVYYIIFPPPVPEAPPPAPVEIIENSQDVNTSNAVTDSGEPASMSKLSGDGWLGNRERLQEQESEFIPTPSRYDIFLETAPERKSSTLVETEHYLLHFTNQGALLQSLILKNYFDKHENPLELIPPHMSELDEYPFKLAITADEELSLLANTSLYSMEREELHGSTRLDFTFANAEGLWVTKTYIVSHQGYGINVDISVEQDDRLLQSLVFIGPGLGGESQGEASRFTQRGFSIGQRIGTNRWESKKLARRMFDKALTRDEDGYLKGFMGFRKSLPYHNIDENNLDVSIPLEWVSVEDNYFATVALSKKNFDSFRARRILFEFPSDKPDSDPITDTEYAIGILTSQLDSVYFVPKDRNLLGEINPGFRSIINLGVFSWLAIPLIWMLEYFYQNIFSNYGLAIIAVTFIVKVLFYPLTHKSFVSMRRMQEIQPKMNALREKYKKKKDAASRQKMNEELMALYKKEGVNPMGGCLPMLLQLPVLWAFYTLLGVTFQLRHAPFIFWIGDLSQKDPYYITPIVMGATMYIQQTMSMSQTKVTGPMASQQRMMRWMPVMFTWFFLQFPSGLVLYWLTNNILTIAQQRLIYKKLDANKGKPQKKKSAIEKADEKPEVIEASAEVVEDDKPSPPKKHRKKKKKK